MAPAVAKTIVSRFTFWQQPAPHPIRYILGCTSWDRVADGAHHAHVDAIALVTAVTSL
jgi:hypothetical protein